MSGEEIQLLRKFVEVASDEQIREISQNGPNALTQLEAFLSNSEKTLRVATQIVVFLHETYGFAPTPEEVSEALREIKAGIQYVRDTYGITPLGFFVTRALSLPNGQKVEVPAYLQEARIITVPFAFFQYAGVLRSPHVVSTYRQKPGHYFPGSFFYRVVAIEEAAHCHQDFEGRYHLPSDQLVSDGDLDFEKEIDVYFEKAFRDLSIPVFTTSDDNIQLPHDNIYTVVRETDRLKRVS